jgi:hypothetical protein
MHTVSFSYPECPDSISKDKAFEFMHGIANMIPCMRCRTEWTRYLKEHIQSRDSAHLSSRYAFSKFLVDGHNFVNKRIGKPELTYDYVVKLYTKGSTDYSKLCYKIIKYILFCVLMFVLVRILVERRMCVRASHR